LIKLKKTARRFEVLLKEDRFVPLPSKYSGLSHGFGYLNKNTGKVGDQQNQETEAEETVQKETRSPE
jgi:hypothetical protein